MKWFRNLTWPNKIALVLVVIVGIAVLASTGKQPGSPAAPGATAASTAPAATPAPASPAPATPAPAAPPERRFGAADLATVMETSQTNEARFKRDFKGKLFSATGSFDSLQEMLGDQQVTVDVGEFQVMCTGGKALAAKAIDWNSGDRVTISGSMTETLLGTVLYLNDCDVTK